MLGLYLLLFVYTTSCSPRTIFVYWKDLLSVTSKASLFSGAIFKPLLSNQRFARHRLLLILRSRVPTSLAAHTTSASSVKSMMLIPVVGRPMRRKSWCMTFHTSGTTRDPWGAPHVISPLWDHLPPSVAVYKMRHPLEVSLPAWEGPTSTSSIRQRTFPLEDRSWRLPEGSLDIPRSPLWGSCLALRWFPVPYWLWAFRSLSLVVQK